MAQGDFTEPVGPGFWERDRPMTPQPADARRAARDTDRRSRLLARRPHSASAERLLKKHLRKVFPDHWSFMLGEIALYCFIVLLLTGIYLTFFFKPSMAEVVYHGSLRRRCNGIEMSEAYASTLRHLASTCAAAC